MATITLPWNGASGGMLTVTYPDSGSGDIVISSTPLSLFANSREMTIMLITATTPPIFQTLTVRQERYGII